MAVDWARLRGRRLLVLTVDHRLNPESASWTRRAGDQARALGCAWRGLVWDAPVPGTGLPAAARAARHALIAGAAREAGASVILMAHTLDDAVEADLMRAEGTPIGRVREWSPSPVWPEGREVQLFRPLLDVARADLRALLVARGLDWIEDPANADLRFARARARSRLPLPSGGGRIACDPTTGLSLAERSDAPGERVRNALSPAGPLPTGEGIVAFDRLVDPRALAATLTCVGGGVRTPSGDQLERLTRRLHDGGDFHATLCGARLSARADVVQVHREPGDQRRAGLAPLRLEPGVSAIWDGRYEVTGDAPGLTVAAALGRMASLAPADRADLSALPAAARGAVPVLIRDGDSRPVLAAPDVRMRPLVPLRLAGALDLMPHETDLIAARMAPDAVNAYFEFHTDGRPAGAA
jgi:tRNA(Ile)-lysidine synthase